MNHSYLGGVAVDQGGLPAFLDKVCNDFSGLFDSGLLLWKIGSKVFVTDCYYKSLFCHNVTSFLDAQYTVYYNGGKDKKQGVCTEGQKTMENFGVSWYDDARAKRAFVPVIV